MQAGSAFSGIGGGDLGMEIAGIETVWQIENAKFPRRVLEARWPQVKRYDDVSTVDVQQLERVDVLHGGFPCQDVSVAGRRAGLAGERSGLFFEFARIAAALKPQWIVIENVPGLLSSNGGRDMGTVLHRLGQFGYGWAYRVLDAQYFGLAQRRARVFIVGCLGDARRAAAVLFEPEGGSGDLAPGRGTGQDVAYALRKEPGGVGQAWNTNFVAATLNSGGNDGGFRTEPGEHLVVNARQDPITSKVAQPLDTDAHSQAVLLRMREGKEGGGKGPLLQVDKAGTLATANDQTLFQPIAMLLAPPLRTNERNNSNGGTDALSKVYEPMGVRKLTPLECERLQGFPDGWTCLCDAHGLTAKCTCPDSPRYKGLGNAIAVPVMAWIANRIMASND